jgi:hypothetical protein
MNFLSQIIISFFPFVFICCNSEEVEKKEKFKKSNEEEYVSIGKLKNEVLYYDSLFINGRIPLKVNKDKLFNILGKPTIVEELKLATWLIEYNLEDRNNTKKYFFGNTIFEGSNDTLLLRQFDFEKTTDYLYDSKIIFSRQTTIDSVYKVFPESYKVGQIMCGNSCHGIIQLYVNKSSNGTMWHLLFKGGNLKRITFFDDIQ